jgi:hypothetical protein
MVQGFNSYQNLPIPMHSRELAIATPTAQTSMSTASLLFAFLFRKIGRGIRLAFSEAYEVPREISVVPGRKSARSFSPKRQTCYAAARNKLTILEVLKPIVESLRTHSGKSAASGASGGTDATYPVIGML